MICFLLYKMCFLLVSHSIDVGIFTYVNTLKIQQNEGKYTSCRVIHWDPKTNITGSH